MRQSSITELDLDVGPMSVRLRRPAADFEGTSQARLEADASAPPASVPETLITAPMIGTFYTSATPGAQPFVNEGDEVYVGQTIGIIEAMKIMNEIAADASGVVETILVGNGQPVEYGSPLMRLRAGQGQHS
ncbi:MAG: acetyl-CoA carboxylase, biotin carboxyl carrier protein [Chloroflexi bacterium]|nr:acetyl-CoA carboxylase, biotin carboxyl carrier protein [Chloroflexota bacterium]